MKERFKGLKVLTVHSTTLRWSHSSQSISLRAHQLVINSPIVSTSRFSLQRLSVLGGSRIVLDINLEAENKKLT